MEVDNTLKQIITPYKPQNSPKFRVCGVEVVNYTFARQTRRRGHNISRYEKSNKLHRGKAGGKAIIAAFQS